MVKNRPCGNNRWERDDSTGLAMAKHDKRQDRQGNKVIQTAIGILRERRVQDVDINVLGVSITVIIDLREVYHLQFQIFHG